MVLTRGKGSVVWIGHHFSRDYPRNGEEGKNSKWPSFSHRLAKTFQATKKSGKRALKSQDPVRFHDWRKKAKKLLYQLQFTKDVTGKQMTKNICRVDKLQEKLGNYHDSVVAQDHLQRNLPDDASLQLVKYSVGLLEKRKYHLQRKIQNIAQHIKYHS